MEIRMTGKAVKRDDTRDVMNGRRQRRGEIMTRESDFSYKCNQCGRCCIDKIIHVNPYETARLASSLGTGTTRFLKEYTAGGGTVLRARDDGSCVFLDGGACAVHRDRPLVCRLYPLGRFLDSDRAETFKSVTPHPGCEGSSGENGTVAGYLSEQETGDFFRSADAYLELTGKLIAALRAEAAGSPFLASRLTEHCRAPSPEGAAEIYEWLDMDHVVSLALSGEIAVPSLDIAEKMKIHIRAVESWLGKTEKEEAK